MNDEDVDDKGLLESFYFFSKTMAWSKHAKELTNIITVVEVRTTYSYSKEFTSFIRYEIALLSLIKAIIPVFSVHSRWVTWNAWRRFKESPRLLASVSADGDLSQCCVLFDRTRQELKEQVSLQRALILLMATYYVFDILYPQPYMNCMLVLSKELLEPTSKVKSSNRSIVNFYQKFDKIQLWF